MRTCTLTCAIIVACAPGIVEEAGDAAWRGRDEERAEQARVLPRVAEACVSPRVLAAEAGVGDELDRPGREAADGGDHLVGELAFAGIDHEGALIAGLHHDVGAVAHEHVDVVADWKHVDLAVARLAIGGFARFRSAAGRRREQRAPFGVTARPEPGFQFGIHRHRPQQPRRERNLVARRELVHERLLAEQVVGDGVVRPIEDLLAVVAGIQPRAGIDRLPREVAAPHHRFGEIHGIGDHR
jgi:hypothetical protein